MPRYFFHTEDGQCFPDNRGLELPDLEAARQAAMKTMHEMSAFLADDIWRTGTLRVTVSDERGLTLMMLELAATTAPAVSNQHQRAPDPRA